jgi:hypothetical protein
MFKRAGLLAAVALFVGSHVACNKPEAPAKPAPDVLESVTPQSSPSQPLAVLDKTFDVKTSATFSFQLPAHSAQPHLHGVFESFLGKAHGPSNEAANIDFVIMNEDQHSDFASNRPSESLFSVEESHNQAVNLDLPPTITQPVKYYLVFQNPRGSKTNKVVQANFRIDF